MECLELQNLTPERPVRTGDSKNQAQRSTSRRKNAPQRPMASQAARRRSLLTRGAAASAHPGQLPAVRPARARSPGNRLPRLEGPGRETRAAGSAVAGGKCGADISAPIGQARPRSAAPGSRQQHQHLVPSAAQAPRRAWAAGTARTARLLPPDSARARPRAPVRGTRRQSAPPPPGRRRRRRCASLWRDSSFVERGWILA